MRSLPILAADSLFHFSASSTAKLTNETFRTRYGDGSIVAGQVYTDEITIAGFTVWFSAVSS